MARTRAGLANIPLATLEVTVNAVTAPFLVAMKTVEQTITVLSSKFTQIASTTMAKGIEGLTEGAIQLQSQMATLSRTSGLAGESLRELKDEILHLGSTMAGVKLEDLMEIATIGTKIGIPGTKIGQYTKDIAMMSAVMKEIPAEELATRVQRVLNLFNLGTESALGFGSALNKLDLVSTANARDILRITTAIAGHASALGVSFERVMALAAAMKEAGIEDMIGATAVDQVLAKMATETDKFAAVAGKNVKEFEKMMKEDAIGALMVFIDGLKKFDANSQFRIFDEMKLEGRRTAGTMLQLSRTIGRVNPFTELALAESKSAESIKSSFAIIGQTVAAQLQRLSNVAMITGARIGESFLKPLAAWTDALIVFAERFGSFMKRQQPVIDQFTSYLSRAIKGLSMIFDDPETVLSLIVLEIKRIGDVIAELAQRAWPVFWEAFKAAGDMAIRFMFNLIKGGLDVMRIQVINMVNEITDAISFAFKPIGFSPIAKIPVEPLEKRMADVVGASASTPPGGWGGLKKQFFDIFKPLTPSPPEDAASKKFLTDKLKSEFEDREKRHGDDPFAIQLAVGMAMRPFNSLEPVLRTVLGQIGEKKANQDFGDKYFGMDEANKQKGGFYSLQEYYKHIQTSLYGNPHEKKTEGFLDAIAKSTRDTADAVKRIDPIAKAAP